MSNGPADGNISPALTFDILANCKQSMARTAIMKLPHYEVETPVFMPVGTQVIPFCKLVTRLGKCFLIVL